MTAFARTGFALLLSLALTGCYVKIHGVESTGGGATVTTTSSQAGGTARFSGGQASFSSGPRTSPGATGGHISLGKGASAVVVVGLVFADLLDYIAGTPAPKPLSPDERIMETCSCFQKSP